MFAQALRTFRSSNRLIFTTALLSLLMLAACGSPAPAPAAESDQMETSTTEAQAPVESEEATTEEDMAEDEKMDDSAMSESHAMTETVESDSGSETETAAEMTETATDEEEMPEAMAAVDLPSWQQLAVTDARSGESFTFADFNGKTVFVEPMATWCGNCRRQLTNVQEASSQLGDDVVFIALSVETNIDGSTLASYADDAGFNYTFAVMTPEMLSELAAAFGQTISNPPATPHFIIRPDGTTTDLVTGIEPAADIVAQIEAARS